MKSRGEPSLIMMIRDQIAKKHGLRSDDHEDEGDRKDRDEPMDEEGDEDGEEKGVKYTRDFSQALKEGDYESAWTAFQSMKNC